MKYELECMRIHVLFIKNNQEFFFFSNQDYLILYLAVGDTT